MDKTTQKTITNSMKDMDYLQCRRDYATVNKQQDAQKLLF